jgi:hypothetical protein
MARHAAYLLLDIPDGTRMSKGAFTLRQTLGFSLHVEGWSVRQPRAFQRCAMPPAPSS